MKYAWSVVVLLLAVSANAQFIKHVDEDGKRTYSDDPQYNYSQDESPSSNNLEQVEEYLRERDDAARQATKQSSKSKIGIGRSLGINRQIRYRKRRDLWRLGLRCQ